MHTVCEFVYVCVWWCLCMMVCVALCVWWCVCWYVRKRDTKRHSTWLFDHKQDGLSAGILVVLEPLYTVVLIFICAVDSIFVMEDWRRGKWAGEENEEQTGGRWETAGRFGRYQRSLEAPRPQQPLFNTPGKPDRPLTGNAARTTRLYKANETIHFVLRHIQPLIKFMGSWMEPEVNTEATNAGLFLKRPEKITFFLNIVLMQKWRYKHIWDVS